MQESYESMMEGFVKTLVKSTVKTKGTGFNFEIVSAHEGTVELIVTLDSPSHIRKSSLTRDNLIPLLGETNIINVYCDIMCVTTSLNLSEKQTVLKFELTLAREPYQIAETNNLLKEIAYGKNILIQGTVGSGKTTVYTKILEHYLGHYRIFYVSPNEIEKHPERILESIYDYINKTGRYSKVLIACDEYNHHPNYLLSFLQDVKNLELTLDKTSKINLLFTVHSGRKELVENSLFYFDDVLDTELKNKGISYRILKSKKGNPYLPVILPNGNLNTLDTITEFQGRINSTVNLKQSKEDVLTQIKDIESDIDSLLEKVLALKESLQY